MPFEPLLPPIPPLVVPARVGSSEGPTRGEARGRGWRRSTAGCYVPGWVDDDQVEQRILEQGHRLRRGAITGWASLRLHRAAYFDGLDRDGRTRLPVPLVENGERLTSSTGRRILRWRLAEEDVEVFRGVLRCAAAPRALLDAIRLESRDREAVVALDMSLAAGVATLAALTAQLDRQRGRPGVARARRLLGACEPRSRSPQESRLRMVWVHDAGWGAPLCNVDVFDAAGAFIGRPDLLDVERGVVGEYDGAEHRSRARHRRDVTREEGFRDVGLEVVTIVGEALRDVPALVARLHQAAARAAGRPRTFTWRA